MNATFQNLGSDPGTAGPSREIHPGSAALRHSEAYLAAAQRLSRTGSFGWKVASGDLNWSEETFRIFEYDSTVRPTVELALQRVHPDDAGRVRQTIARISQEGKEFDFEFRLSLPDGSAKHLRAAAYPAWDAAGELEFVGAVMDVTAAKDAQEKIRLIINAVPALIWTASVDGRLDFISQRLLDYFGVNSDQTLGQEYGRFVHPDEATVLREHWRSKIAVGEPFESEVRLRRFDGEYRWFLSRAVPLRDRPGRVTGWYGNDVDIHERKQAEEKLRESEAYLAETQRLSGTGSFAWNPHTAEIRYWSHECYPMLGFDERNGIPSFQSFLQRIHPDDRRIMESALAVAIRDRADFVHEYRVILPDGEIRHIYGQGHPVFAAAGCLMEFLGSVIDNTERHQAGEALRQSEERLRLIVDNIPGMLCTHTPAGELEFANQRLLDYTGKTLVEMQNWDWTTLIHPDDLHLTLQRWEHSVATGDPYAVDHRTLGISGSYRWFHVTGHPLRNVEGRLVRWYILLSDIDDRKKAEDALSKAQTELAHITRVTTMGELTASIAHEVNQPLTAVVNNANASLNLLQRAAPNLEDVREALADIIEDADRASAVLARIRQLAKRAPYEKSLLDVRTVIADVLLLARGESSARSVAIHTELPDAPLPVLGDRVQLQQVLLNLVVNAMDAMNTIEKPRRRLLIRACQRRDRDGRLEAQVSVQDSGIGLAPEHREGLFRAFYTTKPQGMGMGLSISLAIVEAHGGRLWAVQNEGDGATFVFSLPDAGSGAP